MVSRCKGKIIIIDTGTVVHCLNGFQRRTEIPMLGISKAYGGVLSALSITYSLMPTASVASSKFEQSSFKGQRYVERETIKVIYEQRNETLVDEERVIEGIM